MSETPGPIVLSPYMSNASRELLDAQRRVFAHLNVPLEQVCIDGTAHGAWMDNVAKSEDAGTVVFADIDAFPLTRAAHERAVAAASDGRIFGLAQSANHLANTSPYAGPCYLAFDRMVFRAIGSPSLAHDYRCDPAQALSIRAYERQVAVELVRPTTVLKPLWPLGSEGLFGIGTFYGANEFFHLFQSRRSAHIDIFLAVASDVLEDRLDFAAYIAMAQSNDARRLMRLGRLEISMKRR